METRRTRRTPQARPRARLGARLAGLLLALPLPAAAAQDEQPAGPTRSFSIPETRQARALFDRAREHLAAERWPEAIADLQKLLVEHKGDVLGDERVTADGTRSEQPVHPGVAEAARRALHDLPARARALYAERFAGEAGEALERARRAADRRALVEVARRWPIADAAREAWWAIGDLELELGNPRAAADAWHRARDLAALAEVELSPGARARLAFLETAFDDGALGAPEPINAQHPPGPGEAAASAPGPDAHSWIRAVDTGSRRVPFGSDSPETYNLFPAQAGDTLLVSNSLRVFAFDAWTGKERWRSDEPPGWDLVDTNQMFAQHDGERLDRAELFDAIDRRSVTIAPAAAGAIVVAALQIPMTQLGNTRYQNIPITRAIPDRRLFAYDLESGRELWNHMPPPLWDGEAGGFSERMRVAAPPVIAGSRVLVPVYRMQGRIDYHLACYDLFSGSLLWSTALISGQLPLNMFGRHSTEFAAAPVRVEGDRVLALTQLGAIAACDLYTGEVLWETLYEQIPLPPTMHWTPRERRLHWCNAPPVVADGVLVATPLDSRDLVGLDVEHGALLWSLPYDSIQRRGDYTRLALLGADRDAVYLAGRSVMSCRAPAGLRAKSGPIEVTYGPDLPVEHQEFLPRPALGERHLIAPTPLRRVAIDRFNIRYEDRQASADWGPEQAAGNALLGDGALFLLSNRFLTAIFDWDVLEQRAEERYAAEPENDPLAMAYAELLAGRGRAEVGQARLASAGEHLARAREIVAGRLEGADRGYHAELEALLHRILRDEAAALERSARPWTQVLELLRQAEAVAPGEEAARDTLLAMAALLDASGARAEWLATLERLDARCGALPLPAAPADSASAPAALDATSATTPPISVGLWVAFQLARDRARRGDVAGELEVLHGVLAEHGNATLLGYEAWAPAGGSPSVAERIGDLIAAHGRAPYEPFERRARAALEAARAAEGPGGPGAAEALERVIEHYPHSAAAALAIDARIEGALAAGDTKKVVSLVQRSIPERWSARGADAREVELLLRMGLALERAGNAELFERLVSALAAQHPALVPDFERGERGRTLAELAASFAPAGTADAEAPGADFDQSARVRSEVAGSFDLIEVTGATGGRPELLLAVRDSRYYDEVSAFSAADPSQPFWFRRIEDGVLGDRQRAACAARETLTLAGTSALLGIDLQDGTVRWKWNADPSGVAGVAGDAGVVIGVFGDVRQGALLRAFDAARGYQLWTREVEPGEQWPLPVVGSGRAVLLPRTPGPGRALVLDVFTGAETGSFELPPVDSGDLDAAWIEDGALILPRFPRTTPSNEIVTAWDLDRAERLWATTNSEGLDFDSVARADGQVYLLFTAGRQKPGAIQQLTRSGAARTLNVRVRPGDAPIGMDRHRVTRLAEPWLYLQSSSETSDSETIVRAIHLPFGEKWRHRLPVAPSEIYDGLPLPISSQRTTVLAWTEPTRDLSVRPMTQLLFLDRELGTLQDSRSLNPDLGPAGTMTFALLGPSLAILGSHEMIFLAR